MVATIAIFFGKVTFATLAAMTLQPLLGLTNKGWKGFLYYAALYTPFYLLASFIVHVLQEYGTDILAAQFATYFSMLFAFWAGVLCGAFALGFFAGAAR